MTKSLVRFIGGLFLIASTIGVGAFGIALATAGPAGATTTLIVNDALDGTATPANCTTSTEATGPDCTLRAALEQAQNLAADTTITVPDAADVEFNPSTSHIYQVLSTSGSNSQLDVNDDTHTVTINGAGPTASILQAQCTGTCTGFTTRVLKVETGTTADISGVTVEDGNPSGAVGGGILNCGTLVLNDSFVSNNTAADSGGGIEASNGASTTLTSDTINNNTQSLSGEQGGGGIYIVGDATAGSLLSISESTIIEGNVADGGPGGGITLGGSANVNTVATIDSSTIFDNTTNTNGGGIAQVSDSTLTVTNSFIIGNGPTESATIDGGGVYLLADSTSVDSFTSDTIGEAVEAAGEHIVAEDTNTADEGGGVYIQGVDPTFTDVNITHNVATNSGGGVYINSGGTNTFSGGSIDFNSAADDGGAVFIDDGTNSFTGGSISNNETTGSGGRGGGVAIDDGINTFSGETINSNQAQNDGNGGGVNIDDGTNTFTDTAVNSNQAIWTSFGGLGGGFFYDGGTNTFTGGSIDSNQAYEGGGSYLDGGTETFTQADISSNTATEGGAGLLIVVENVTTPTTITSSTISQNALPPVPSGITTFVGDGGGILAEGCNQINLTNDTIAGNTASLLGGGYYGAECNLELGPNQPAAKPKATPQATSHVAVQPVTNFLFDTIDANTSGEGGGNVVTSDTSKLNAAETIIADGVGGPIVGNNCTFTDGGTLNSGGYNLIDDSTCGTPAATDIIGKSALLGSLGNNGGPTATEVPGTGSPAISAIPSAVCSGTGVTTDQRGNARGAGTNGSCTIGAVEVAVAAPPSFNPNGYRMVADEGGIFDFGLNFNGSLANNHLNAPIVGIANSPGPNGYLMVGSDGGVFALGGANFYGSLCCNPLPSPIAAIAATPAEDGYWLASQSGTISHFGNTPALPAVQVPAGAHIVGMASTNDGKGLWLTDNLGDVYAVGDALYLGGMGGIPLNAPVVGIAAAATGQGYVLVASDGGTFNFGVGFFGSVPGSLAPGQHLVAPIVGIAVTHSGKGYWMVGADGGLFNYGDAPFLGSIYTAIDGTPLNGPIVGIQHLGSAPPG